MSDLVAEQMSREYGCASDDVDVVEIGEERFGATGCGESIAYFVHCEGRSTSSCVAIREYPAAVADDPRTPPRTAHRRVAQRD